VAIVRTGRVVYEGSLPELIATTAGRYELRTTDDTRAAEVARAEPEVEDVARAHGALTFTGSEDAAARLSIALAEAGVGIRALVPRSATLEELFFRMTEGDPAVAPRPEPVGERA
jgi:ABC-2 type transport system ATP-binding protein